MFKMSSKFNKNKISVDRNLKYVLLLLFAAAGKIDLETYFMDCYRYIVSLIYTKTN